MEEWKGMIYNGVDYSEHIEVSCLGRLRRRGNTSTLKPFIKQSGYQVVCTTAGSRSNKRHFSIHKAVAETFVLNKRPKVFTEVNHIDGRKDNNAASNLEWCDRSRNMKHAFRTGLVRVPGQGQALGSADARVIAALCVPGDRHLGVRAMAKHFGVSRYAVNGALKNAM